MAKGVATITVRCGEQIATFEVTCNLPNEPAYPTEPTDPTIPTTKPTEPTEPTKPLKPNANLKLKSKDITLRNYGETADLYYNDGVLTRQDIVWTSSNENVITVSNGIVTAVGKGTAYVYAEYGNQKVSCIVRCETVVVSDYEIRTQVVPDRISTDITIKVGDTIKFYLVNKKTGERVDVTELIFKSTNPSYFTVDENGVVTAIKSNSNYNQYLEVVHNGITYKCQIRITN